MTAASLYAEETRHAASPPASATAPHTEVIPYARQSVDEQDIAAVCAVLRSEYLTQGGAGPEFERAVADYCGVDYAVAVNSATSALHVACLSLGLGPGDTLWTSPTTFVASANCALHCGARVDFVDIDPRTYNMSPSVLAEKLLQAERGGHLPKIVVPVHMCGQPCEMAAIHALGQKYGFRIIEDASHALGAQYRGERVGGCRYSDITVFSFHPVKMITTGEGGMALTRSHELAMRMAQYRTHGITASPGQTHPRPSNEIWNYQQIRLGFNYRMTDMQAALGVSQMAKLDTFVEARRRLARTYDSQLAPLPLRIPWQHPDGISSYHLYAVRIDTGSRGPAQAQVYRALHAAGILVNVHYIPVYRHPYYESLGFKPGLCPEAERLHREVISLPLFPGLTDSQQSRVVSELERVLS